MDTSSETKSEPREDQSQRQLRAEAQTGIDQHKALAIIGYILPILFFVPMITEAKANSYARFHANQQLTLLLYWVVVSVVLPVIPVIGWLLIPIAYILGVVLVIMGVMNAAQGTMKSLPLLGSVHLIR